MISFCLFTHDYMESVILQGDAENLLCGAGVLKETVSSDMVVIYRESGHD